MDQKIKFTHIRTVSSGGLLHPDELLGKGGITVAYKQIENQVSFAYARCSTKDNYCKAKGRMIAEGRLLAGRNFYSVVVDPKQPTEKQLLSLEPLATIMEEGPL